MHVKKTSHAAAIEKLNGIRQGNRSVEEYAREHEQLHRHFIQGDTNLDVDDSKKLSAFYEGLNLQLKDKFVTFNIENNTYDDLKSFVLDLEGRLDIINSDRQRSYSGQRQQQQNQQPQTTQSEKRPFTHAFQAASRKEMFHARKAAKREMRQQQHSSSQAPAQPAQAGTAQPAMVGTMKGVKCSSCNMEGHRSAGFPGCKNHIKGYRPVQMAAPQQQQPRQQQSQQPSQQQLGGADKQDGRRNFQKKRYTHGGSTNVHIDHAQHASTHITHVTPELTFAAITRTGLDTTVGDVTRVNKCNSRPKVTFAVDTPVTPPTPVSVGPSQFMGTDSSKNSKLHKNTVINPISPTQNVEEIGHQAQHASHGQHNKVDCPAVSQPSPTP